MTALLPWFGYDGASMTVASTDNCAIGVRGADVLAGTVGEPEFPMSSCTYGDVDKLKGLSEI